MPETVRLWSELSGIKVRQFFLDGDKYVVNGDRLVWQVGGDIHEERMR